MSDVYGRHSWEVSCGERAIRSFQLGRYHSITRCALVWMWYDILDHRRRIIGYTTRRKVRNATPVRYMAGTGRILSRLHRGMVRPYPRIYVCTSTMYKRVDNSAVRPHATGSRGGTRTRLVANTSVAGLPSGRIRLDVLPAGCRAH
jgi:hypothetical protein